jgi:hypothetical protein
MGITKLSKLQKGEQMQNIKDQELDNYIFDLKQEVKALKRKPMTNVPISIRWRYWRDKAMLFEGICKMQERRIKRIKKKYNIK